MSQVGSFLIAFTRGSMTKRSKRLNLKAQVARISAPIRKSKAWKVLRRKVLRSPFKGYFAKSWQELKKVEWPNRKTSWRLTFTVIVFSLFFAVLTAGLDYGFEKLAKQIFLK